MVYGLMTLSHVGGYEGQLMHKLHINLQVGDFLS